MRSIWPRRLFVLSLAAFSVLGMLGVEAADPTDDDSRSSSEYYSSLSSTLFVTLNLIASLAPAPQVTPSPTRLFDCEQYRGLCMAVSSNATDVDALCQTVNSATMPIAGKSTGVLYRDVPVPKAIELPVPLVGPSGPDPYVGCSGFGSAGGVSYICTTTGNPSSLQRNITGVCIAKAGVVEKLPPYVPLYNVVRTTSTLATSTKTGATATATGTTTKSGGAVGGAGEALGLPAWFLLW
ncbi:hypothetical protein BC829DRAFT_444218 [Chytridium lagenaria]|nr:hypothetical protein BC829DRAFT_444218 [Chytridium lagenaria]